MIHYPQFLLWTVRDGRKLPVSARTGEVCNAHDPTHWSTYTEACASIRNGHRLAFAFTRNDPLFFLDFDNALEPSGQWSQLSQSLISMCPGAAVEVSNSGRGLHLIGQYSGQEPIHACKAAAYGLELYTSDRFVALTDRDLPARVTGDHTGPLSTIIAQYFPDAPIDLSEWTTDPVDEWCGPADDNELIKRALASRTAAETFQGRAGFGALWRGEPGPLAAAYPDNFGGGRPYDESTADAGLAQHLAFWTGKNCERIYNLMWRSALVRNKWMRAEYLQRTIRRAVSLQKDVYNSPKDRPQGARVESAQPVLPTEITVVSGYQYLTADAQTRHFQGCIYIQDLHRVFTPSGALLRQDQFRATYGGYVFQLDEAGKATTRNAWEAFVESQVIHHPKVQTTCFYPKFAPGAIVSIEGRRAVNCYVPVEVPRREGDPSRFLDHLTRLLPLEGDRQIILAYMAACVQHKGVKFQWAPLIQGVEGNGKTLLTRCVAQAIGRRYVHYPKAMDIDNKFNGWLLNKLFIGVEDIHVPDNRREIIETLKPMITGGDGLEIQMKGVDQITVDICANFILNSNHRDAIRKTELDRRFAVFYTAQQGVEDLRRDGMGGMYFPNLYDWLRAEGYAIVSEYLHTYPIPEHLNPATQCHRAPETSSTNEAIRASLGRVEQEVIEAIDEERLGFAGGWVSSRALDRLLQLRRSDRTIPPNKRRELMRAIGYDWHPGLREGRVNSPSMVDESSKPRLFVRRNHPARDLTDAGEILRQYVQAQQKV